MKKKQPKFTHKDVISWRKKYNMTQVEAGLALGVSRRTWQYWESGNYPVPKNLQNRIKFLEMTMI
jgi:DNA-binding XRE family transcriptional regulator